MKKPLISWVVLPLVAACADSDMLTSSDALTTPSAAVVSSISPKNGKGATTSGGGALVVFGDFTEDFIHGSPGPTKSANLAITLDLPFCRDFVPLSKGDFSWSMSKATVNVSTACGQVNVSWSRTGPVTTGHSEEWFSFPTLGIETCSPPPGETAVHFTSNGKSAVASASGTIGLSPFADPSALIFHGVANLKECQ